MSLGWLLKSQLVALALRKKDCLNKWWNLCQTPIFHSQYFFRSKYIDQSADKLTNSNEYQWNDERPILKTPRNLQCTCLHFTAFFLQRFTTFLDKFEVWALLPSILALAVWGNGQCSGRSSFNLPVRPFKGQKIPKPPSSHAPIYLRRRLINIDLDEGKLRRVHQTKPLNLASLITLKTNSQEKDY